MKVQARFKLNTIEHHATHDHSAHMNLSFSVVTADREENKSWSKWTPTGELTMTITNPDCVAAFEVGEEYRLDIEKV